MKFSDFIRRRPPHGWFLLHDLGVQFPDDVHQLLIANFIPDCHRVLQGRVVETLTTLSALGVPRESELAHLYVNYGPYTVTGWYELNEIEQLAPWTKYASDELQVPDNYVALTSIEGQGIALYDCRSEAVYDVEYGQFETLAANELEPVADSISAFIRWCAKRGAADSRTSS